MRLEPCTVEFMIYRGPLKNCEWGTSQSHWQMKSLTAVCQMGRRCKWRGGMVRSCRPLLQYSRWEMLAFGIKTTEEGTVRQAPAGRQFWGKWRYWALSEWHIVWWIFIFPPRCWLSGVLLTHQDFHGQQDPSPTVPDTLDCPKKWPFFGSLFSEEWTSDMIPVNRN